MDEQATARRRVALPWIAIILAAVVAIVAILVTRWRKQQAARLLQERRPISPAPVLAVRGLTQAEAAARRQQGQDNVILFKPPRSQHQIWRENVYNLFNLNLVGLAIAQLLLGRPLDALLSVGTIALNIGINIGQELLALRRLSEVERTTRPQATVIREEKVQSIDPSEIVLGDMLVVGPGDQLLVDGEVAGEGQIAVDESMLTGESILLRKHTGDKVYAGSFCVDGRAAYQAQKVGNERLIASRVRAAPVTSQGLTPLERVIDRVLRILLVIVILLTAFVLLNYSKWNTVVPVEVYTDVVSVIFNIAPSSLFFMIILAYAAGTADLAKLGALVHRARSVESLAQAATICFTREGILTGTHIEVETIEAPENQERLAESRIRQILGDYARTTAVDNLMTRAMVANFEGSRRTIHEEAPFLSVYGWSAISFDDEDLRGVYVLADPRVLEAYPATVDEKAVEEQDQAPSATWKKMVAPLGRLFKRTEPPPEEDEIDPAQRLEPKAETPAETEETTDPEAPMPSENGMSKPNLFARLTKRVNRILRRKEAAPEEEEAPEDPTTQEVVLRFAYHPELTPLHTADGLPQLPEKLVPLCNLRYTERVRAEAVDTVRTFSETGVSIKIFSSRPPDQTATVLRQAGLGKGDDAPVSAISGTELSGLGPDQLTRAASENTIFGQITSEQTGQVVEALRAQGQSVAVVGDGVSDVSAMLQANLSIARQSSSQAALSVADIILLEDSPGVLSRVLEKGQRIVNGLLDVLKLQLTQVVYLTLLVAGVRLVASGFPFRSQQLTVISVATVVVPSMGLSLWAVTGVLPHKGLHRLLAHFVLPAAATMSVAALIVYFYFLDTTGEVAYAQLALTHTMVISGLLLVVFVRPPWRTRRDGNAQGGDWRPTILVLGLLATFFAVAAIPLAQEYLRVSWLRQPSDYLVVGLVVLAWAITVRCVWWLVPLKAKS